MKVRGKAAVRFRRRWTLNPLTKVKKDSRAYKRSREKRKISKIYENEKNTPKA